MVLGYSVVQKKRARLARREMLAELPVKRRSGHEFYIFERPLRYLRCTWPGKVNLFMLLPVIRLGGIKRDMALAIPNLVIMVANH